MLLRLLVLWAALTAVTTGCLLAVAAAVLAVAGSFAQVCALAALAAVLAVLAIVIALRAPYPGAACAVDAAPEDHDHPHRDDAPVRGGRPVVPQPRTSPEEGSAAGAAVPARSGAGTAAPVPRWRR